MPTCGRILAFRPKGRTQTRTWTLIVILFDIGVRIDEALGLEREKVDLDGLRLTVTGMGHRQRIVPISIEGRRALYRLMAKPASDSTYVFRTASGQRLSYRNAYAHHGTSSCNAIRLRR